MRCKTRRARAEITISWIYKDPKIPLAPLLRSIQKRESRLLKWAGCFAGHLKIIALAYMRCQCSREVMRVFKIFCLTMRKIHLPDFGGAVNEVRFGSARVNLW